MEQERLQKYFTDCGVMSRRAAEAEILAGNVTVNGRVAVIGEKITPGVDEVAYLGKPIRAKAKKEYTYVMLNKPRGYVTSMSDPQGRKCVTELLTGLHTRVYPVGRLDMISEGCLILTDDGDLANKLTHPRHAIPKHYRVKVGGAVTEEQLSALNGEMEIDGYRLRPSEVEITDVTETGTVLRFTLHEGRNRQIRKMCQAVGLDVRRLNRVSVGEVSLNRLPVGKWRYLTEAEIAYLKKNAR